MSEGSESLPVRLAQEYRVKLGKSFTFPEKNAFHTLKYDFKPQSVDPTRPGHLTITEEEAVNVSLPVGQSDSGDDYAQFRGPKKTCTKECILIIDRETGEAILERISDTVQLKATRDSHKPMHTDRSVSPSPFLSQPKVPPPKPGYSKTSSASYSNPSKKHHGTASNRKPKATPKPTKSDFGGKNLAVTPKTAGSGTNSSVKVEKRKQKLVKASSQPKMGLASGYNVLQPPKPGGIDSGSQETTTPDISPLPSSNPTPEPGAAPPKRPRLSSGSSSSSSSGSSSSGSDSGEEMPGHMTSLRPAIPAVPSIPVSSRSDSPKGTTGSYPYSQAKQAPSSLHPPAQKSDTSRPISRSSSAGQTQLQQQQKQQLSRSTMLAFVDATSAQLLNRPVPRLDARSGIDGTQPVKAPTLPLSQQQGARDKPVGVVGGAAKTTASSSSSSSDSDSSSGSSSSDSSSDSDGEVDREVAHAFSNAPKPARQMSMSVLRSDLNLSESESDSD